MAIRGYLDYFRPSHEIGGWAATIADDAGPIALDLRAYWRGSLVAEGRTTRYRDDTKGTHGFRLKLPEPCGLDALLTTDLAVYAAEPGGPPVLLRATRDLLDAARTSLIKKQVSLLSGSRRAALVADLAGRAAADTADDQAPATGQALSHFSLEPGLVSKDKSVILGKGGYLFIWQGSNNLQDQYSSEKEAEADRLAGAWVSTIAARKARVTQDGRRFLQVVIPEKSSLLPELRPDEIRSATPLFTKLDEGLSSAGLSSCSVTLLAGMRESHRRKEIFRRLDSHLTPFGAFFVFRAMLGKLGLDTPPEPTFDVAAVLQSDLGAKFDPLPLREVVHFPQPSGLASWVGEPEKLSEELVTSGHVGTKVIWRNKSARLPFKVVVFANSFFELGRSPANLSWWAARWFREFHFLWLPYLDPDYLGKTAPDIVICQTIERFLTMVPRA